MTTDIWIVTAILSATIVAFMLDRLRSDFVAFISLLSLLLTGILTPQEATSGFSNSLVMMIAGLFVVGGAILQSGVADLAGRWLGRVAGRSPIRQTVTVMLASAMLAAVLSANGTVAVMLPIVLSLCRRNGVSPTKLLIPLAFAVSLGGSLTLIGTTSNLVVSAELREAGLESFRFFSFAPAGLVMLTIGVVYMTTVGTRLLPKPQRDLDEVDAGVQTQGLVSRPALIHSYGVGRQVCKVRIPEHSEFAGHTLRDLQLRSVFHVNALAVSTPGRQGPVARRCNADTLLLAGDILFIKSSSKEAIANLVNEGQIELIDPVAELPSVVHLAELIVPPRSELIGKTVREIDFFRTFGAMVLALQHGVQRDVTRTSDTPLQTGDTLLIAANAGALKRLRNSRSNLLLVSEQEEQSEPLLAASARWVVMILIAMLLVMATGLVPNVIAVLVAATLMVSVGAFHGSSVYRSINWESIVMIASIMPLAIALEKTSALDLIVRKIVDLPELTNPTLLLLLLFVITSLLSQAISSTATSLLIAPLAMQFAARLDLSPYPLLMGVALAAASAFSTPVASPVNVLVAGAGGYRFIDFLKVGVPLQLMILVGTIVIVPILFPFSPS
ncbi:MAG: SLC13 family permease [Novipirellula sp. JB048]